MTALVYKYNNENLYKNIEKLLQNLKPNQASFSLNNVVKIWNGTIH